MKERRSLNEFIFEKKDGTMIHLKISKIIFIYVVFALMFGIIYFSIRYSDYNAINEEMLYDSIVWGDIISLIFLSFTVIVTAICDINKNHD